METPNYSTRPNITRVLLPRMITLFLLSLLLYLGVRINFIVFEIRFPSLINILVIAAIMILAAADIFLTRKKNRDSRIYFFNDRIEVRGKDHFTIMLVSVRDVYVRRNIFDKLLKTGDISVNDQELKNLNYPDRVRQYIMQLIRQTPNIKNKI